MFSLEVCATAKNLEQNRAEHEDPIQKEAAANQNNRLSEHEHLLQQTAARGPLLPLDGERVQPFAARTSRPLFHLIGRTLLKPQKV